MAPTTKRTPIEVPAGTLRKAPAIIVNVGDLVRLRQQDSWFTVVAFDGPYVVIEDTFRRAEYPVGTDEIEEWRKG
jgi:hypothetical protein